MAEAPSPLRSARARRGLNQTELARRASISRQALGAIEAGLYQPGVSVALRLARELGSTVEELFGVPSAEQISVRFKGPSTGERGGLPSRVALGRVAGRVVAIAPPPALVGLFPASGILAWKRGGRATVETYLSEREIDATLLVAGCDPAITLLADWLSRKTAAVRVVPVRSSSRGALEAVREGRVHAAGVHLRDPKSGGYNLAAVKQALGRRKITVVNFARWELGLAAAPGNPLGLRGFSDLERPGLRIVNREPGSGARRTLDEAIEGLGIERIRVCGYDRELGGHLEVAAAVATGEADMAVTIRVAAESYGLGFIPIREERYDLAIPRREMDSAPVKAMLEAMNSARFSRELADLCSYDTRQMGSVVATIG